MVPRRYERVGDVVLLKMADRPPEVRRRIAEAFGEALHAKTVVEDRGVRGPWREPDVEVLWGDGTETLHVEDGVRFRLDVGRVMFSSGNMDERRRMGRIVQEGETVVDLFAGIGYFALPMAVHGKPSRVIACEVNPLAHRFLEDNARLNRAWSVEPLLGDCRDVAPNQVADRIVMGYLRGDTYLDVAMRAAKNRAVLHYHESVPQELETERPLAHVMEAARRASFRAELIARHRIKSYAPCIRHVVLDVRLTR